MDLVMTTKGQIVYGDGHARSKICPSGTAFAKGVITFTSGEVGPQLHDFGINFTCVLIKGSDTDPPHKAIATSVLFAGGYEPAVRVRANH